MKRVLPSTNLTLKDIPSQNRFGIERKHDVHTGLDIFADVGEVVTAYEKGVVVNICQFTGINVGSEWWNDTWAVLIEGKSGVILYGEIKVNEELKVGDFVEAGQPIGTVMQVLKVFKNKPMSMLHIELYKHGYKGDGEVWIEERVRKLWKFVRPAELLDVEELFK